MALYEVGDTVEVLNDIGKDFKNDKVGEITNVDGYYILIELVKSKVEIECYPNEIKNLSK